MEYAYPHQFEDARNHPDWHQSNGMTLRDWFAGMAMTAATAYETVTPAELAHDAYRIADAMLEARKK